MPIKRSKDSKDSLVSKKIETKNDLSDWRPGPGNHFQKNHKNIPQLWRHQQETPNLKLQIKKKSKLEDFTNP